MTSIDLAQVDDYITISPSVTGHFEQEGKILRFVPDHGLAPNTVYNVKISAGLPVNSDITLAEGMSLPLKLLVIGKFYGRLVVKLPFTPQRFSVCFSYYTRTSLS